MFPKDLARRTQRPVGRQGVDIKQFSQGRSGVLGTPGYPRHCLNNRLPALDLFHPQRIKRSFPLSLLPFLVVHFFVHPGNELRKPLDDLNNPVIFLTNGMKSNTLQALARHFLFVDQKVFSECYQELTLPSRVLRRRLPTV